ncbi:ATP-dependent DNA ligase [Pseudonocardia xinjiangensis]|uniref:ATP-dependent DNA ligase n=1 Tax=Pseudonocardia xinjiangensis TaxID=75289 RepID=UPI003D8FC749
MIAVTAEQLPPIRELAWAFEPKLDGFRCIAHGSSDRITLQSRQQRPLGRYFPEIISALAEFGVDVVLDGELVLWRQGRLDFGVLQRRLHPATSHVRDLSVAMPASFVVFDLLGIDGRDVRSEPYAVRRALLEELLTRQLPHGLVLMPMSTEPAVARAWLLNHSEAGVEGVVAKRMDHPYRAGGRMWRKVRTRFTAEAVVGGVVGTVERPEALIVGRPDHRGRLRVAGRTTPLSRAARGDIAPVLTAAGAEHPWPPTIASSRFGRRPSEPVTYVQVAPTTVVELDVDSAFEDHRWRHPPRFIRVRRDLWPSDVSIASPVPRSWSA